MISSEGYVLPLNQIGRKRTREVQQALTIRPVLTVEFAKPKPFKIYRMHEDTIIVPRHWGVKEFGPASYNGASGDRINVAMKEGFRLDETRHQPQAVDAIMNCLTGHCAGGLLSLHTGAGKTVIATCIVSRLKLKTLVLVHKTFLLNQWRERLQTFLPGARIGHIQGKVCETDCDVCIATIQSIALKDYGDIFRTFGLTIIDECHVVCTRVFSKALEKAQTRFMLGLSATLNRKDKLECVIQHFLGDVIFSAERQNMSATVRLVYSDAENIEEIINKKTQKVDRVAMVTALVACGCRNALIINELCRCVAEGRKILVLSERRQHLAELSRLLCNTAGEDVAGLYVGGMNQAELDTSATKQVILGSYSMASTGLDIKDMDCLLLASPLTDITQACGRILRNQTSNYKLIIDIVDRKSVFLGQMRRRVTSYHRQGFAVRGGAHEDTMKQSLISDQLMIQDE